MDANRTKGRRGPQTLPPVALGASADVGARGTSPGVDAALDVLRPMSGEQKRAMIRVAAYRCFSEGGYHNTTVDKICESLGISKGSFYWYYSGKQAVFTSILEDWAETVEREMEKQFADAVKGANPFVALTEALTMEVRRGRHIMYIWLEFLSQAGRLPYVREGLASFHQRIRAVIVRVLAPIFPADLSQKDREALGTVILAAFMGLVSQELIDPNTAGATDAIRSFMVTLRHLVGSHVGPTAVC
ncbi:MAG: TetR/AcrR family transcriptional regulator [Deltaproteobacteria bacterium]|nr:TetR/AcrR family transcriptional regulator [Deltaproteobacteria bacterium]